jgi:hypothetical protein
MPGHFGGCGPEFPKLERLKLGTYTVANEGQWDWVLRKKSLSSLNLDSCVLTTYIRLWENNMEWWEVQTDGWVPVLINRPYADAEPFSIECVYSYAGTWEKYLIGDESSCPI